MVEQVNKSGIGDLGLGIGKEKTKRTGHRGSGTGKGGAGNARESRVCANPESSACGCEGCRELDNAVADYAIDETKLDGTDRMRYSVYGFACPRCGGDAPVKGGSRLVAQVMTRHRKCAKCGHTFTTRQRIADGGRPENEKVEP